MDSLTPDDLLLRRRPIEHDDWLDGNATAEHASRAVALERFQTLEQILRDNPVQVDPYLELARIYLNSRRWTDARRVLESAVERFPKSEQANFLWEEAQIARSLQLLAEAETAYAVEPTQLTEERVARCNLELNVLREKVCRQRLRRRPSQVELNIPLATALENLGDLDEAINCLKKVVVLPKLRASAALRLGHLYERAGKVLEALSAFRRAAMYRVPPPTRECRQAALSAAANLAERFRLNDSARRYVEMLLELQPDDGELQVRLQKLRQMAL